MAELPFEITPVEVKKALDEGQRLMLLDCREAQEHAICRIDGARLIPMNSVPANLQSLEAMADEALIVVYCHHGMRSLSVVSWLRRQGVESCQSMAGGIDRWSLEIDPSVPRY